MTYTYRPTFRDNTYVSKHFITVQDGIGYDFLAEDELFIY